jgi:hypothetical protein
LEVQLDAGMRNGRSFISSRWLPRSVSRSEQHNVSVSSSACVDLAIQPTHSFLHSRYALLGILCQSRRLSSLPEQCALEIVLTHVFVAVVPVHASYTSVGKVLAWVEVLGTALPVGAVTTKVSLCSRQQRERGKKAGVLRTTERPLGTCPRCRLACRCWSTVLSGSYWPWWWFVITLLDPIRR